MHTPPAGTSEAPSCNDCGLRQLCLLAGQDTIPSPLAVGSRRMARHETLFHDGDPLTCLFAVKAGCFKTTIPLGNGGRQITGFHAAGDLLGFDGIASGHHVADAIALEDAQVCTVEFSRLEAIVRDHPPLQRRIHRSMSRDLVRQQAMLRLLAHAQAEARVCAFLAHQAERQRTRRLPPHALALPMSREDISNLLGLRIETVSRCLSRLETEGILEVRGRRIDIRDRARLDTMAEGFCLDTDRPR